MSSAWCGRSWLKQSMNSSNFACCCRKFCAAGLVASFFKVRCMRSWRPFCWGWPGLMRSMPIPRQPPHGELAQAEQRMGTGEGHAIVGADGFGQAEVLEHPLEYAEGVELPGGRQGFAADQVATGKVADGERVAIAPIGEHELAFVVGAPQIVG